MVTPFLYFIYYSLQTFLVFITSDYIVYFCIISIKKDFSVRTIDGKGPPKPQGNTSRDLGKTGRDVEETTLGTVVDRKGLPGPQGTARGQQRSSKDLRKTIRTSRTEAFSRAICGREANKSEFYKFLENITSLSPACQLQGACMAVV